MSDTNRPPLWQVLINAGDPPCTMQEMAAAEIRALRDWILAELATDPEDEGWGPSNLIELPDLEALLTTEADRAERGDD